MGYKIKKQYRLKNWDYAASGDYFVTICTKDRINYFGKIVDAKMVLSPLGEIAKRCFEEIPINFPCVELDEFIVMPNHVHGILIIHDGDDRRNAPRRVPTNATIRPLVVNSLSSIINHFKGKVKKICDQNGDEYFGWQARFHDRILRNEKELNGARDYINYNPDKWQWDHENIEGLYI